MIAPLRNPCPPRAPEPEHLRLLLRPQETADSLGVSLRTLMAWVDAGEIPFVRIGVRNLRFSIRDLESWIAERSTRKPITPVANGPEQSARSPGNIQGGSGGAVSGAAKGGRE